MWKNVSRDIFDGGARENILRVEKRENITGVSEDIPDKYLGRVQEINVQKKIGEEKIHVAHKTEKEENTRFTDTKTQESGEEEGSYQDKQNNGERVDAMDCKEHYHRSNKKNNDDKQDEDDVAAQLAATDEKDRTDSSVSVVQNRGPHHRDEEWIKVERKKSKK